MKQYFRKSPFLEYLEDIAGYSKDNLPSHERIIREVDIEINDKTTKLERLWRYVLAHNLMYNCAQWVHSEDFYLVCDLADLNPDYVLDRYRKIKGDFDYFKQMAAL